MKLSNEECNIIEEILSAYMEEPNVQEMKEHIHHGAVNTFQHCVNVALVSFWINARFKLNANLRTLLIGAFLHDFYLYDWHIPDKSHKLHGYHHAKIVCDNAIRHFNIGEKEQKIICSHMWPLNLFRVPSSREAMIVCISDKYCSIIESILQRRDVNNIC
jgi:uncharacterized protein